MVNARPSRSVTPPMTPDELPSETRDQRRPGHLHRSPPMTFGFAEVRAATFAPSSRWFACFAPDRREIVPKTSASHAIKHLTSS